MRGSFRDRGRKGGVGKKRSWKVSGGRVTIEQSISPRSIDYEQMLINKIRI
jgi:hypothetical protein